MPTLSKREQLRMANLKKTQAEDAGSIVDDVIFENSKIDQPEKAPTPPKVEEKKFENLTEIPAKTENVASIQSEQPEKPDFIRIKPPVKKQTKSIRKCFLITPEMDDKLKKMADEYGTSENEIINQILTQVL